MDKIQLNFPELEPGDERIQYSCALDAAEEFEGGMSAEEVGAVTNLTRQRVEQIEQQALAKLWRNSTTAKKVRELLDG